MSDPHRKERKWSSKAGAPPLTTIPAMSDQSKAGASMAENTPAMEKQLQYLRKLEERNRIKKKLDEQSKNDKDVHDKEKEVGFTTNFNGENAHRKNKHARPPDKKRAKSAGPMKMPARTAPVAAPQPHHFAALVEQSTKAKVVQLDAYTCRPQGIAEQRDGCIVFAQQPLSASKDDNDDDDDEDDAEPEEGDEEYLDESFEEFEDKVAVEQGSFKELKHDDTDIDAKAAAKPSPPPVTAPTVAPAIPLPSVESDAATSLPLGQTTAELNALIQGLTRDKQRELVQVLQTFTNSTKQASDVQALQQSIADPALWSQLTAPIAQLTSNQRAWEAEMARKLQFERDEGARLMAEAEARRTERLKKLEAEEREFEALMAQRRQEMQRKLMEASLAPPPQATPAPTEQTPVAAVCLPATATTAAVAPPTAAPNPFPEPPQQTIPSAMNTPRPTSSPPKPLASSNPPVPLPSEVYMSLGLPPAAPSAPSQSMVKQSTTALPKPPPLIEVRIKLLSSWGQTRVVGLTQICVYDMDGNELDVPVESLRLYSGQADGQPIPKSNSMVRDLSRLFNGMANTTSEKDMWLGRQIDSHPLQIAFGVVTVPSKLCVWNYNNKMHVGACARDVEVFVDNQCKWTGSLPESYGSEDDNMCTWINVASAMRKKPKDTKPQTAASAASEAKPPLPASADAAPKAGPIWLASSSSVAQLPPKSLKSDASQPSIVSQEKNGSSNDVNSVKPLALDMLPPNASSVNLNKAHTSRRRNLETTGSTTDLGIPKPPTAARLEMPSLQSSWDTLEHFKRTNRSRLEPAEMSTSRTSLGIADSSSAIGQVQPASFQPSSSMSFDKEGKALLARSTSKSSMSELLRAPTLPTPPPAIAIPILPTGRKLVLECLATWGDPYYIGLNGVDIFDERGRPVVVASPQDQVTAVPASINVLPEYASAKERDPRVATNLVDGVNYTCDDLHMWLAPFTPHQVHAVTVEFPGPVTISMLRIWNYNKSRAHSFRGVKVVRILLDSQPIFQGEIRQAPGILRHVDQCCEVILFTTDETLLASIEQVDADPTVDVTLDVVHDIHMIPRPSTAEERNNQRPKTSYSPAIAAPLPSQPPVAGTSAQTSVHLTPRTSSNSNGYRGRVLKLIVQSTWGDRHYVGLTGISLWVLRQDSGDNAVSAFPLTPQHLNATPRDLESLGYVGDPRTLDKLVDGVNVTCDDTHMWLVPFEGGKAELSVHVPVDTVLYGFDVWNYNKSAEDTFRGIKTAAILVDNVVVATIALRKAPGHAVFDFKQTIVLDEWARYPGSAPSPSLSSYKTHVLKQDYEPPLLPTGFLLKFVLWSTWGDPYYVGLNGIELYDGRGDKLPPPTLVAATPAGLADVDVKHDIRVVQNLFQGLNNTWDASEAWLAPLASSLGQCEGNVVFAVFDTPVTLSMVKIYNYSKTPDRGAREIEIYVDDLKVYMGSLRQAPPSPGVTRLGKPQQGVEFGQPILFTLNPSQVESEKRKVMYCGSEDQDVLCINEGQVIIESKAMYRAPDPGAEGVVVDLDKRPTTAMCRT